jgi:tripartite-type tricarboxylate transporter receptor subunit TctC
MKAFAKTFFFAAVLWGAVSGASHAQQEAQVWPARPVRLIVPFALGGLTDIVARILAPALGEALGQPFVVENRPGAAGNIGVEQVVRAAPDGYTVLVGNISTNAINPTAFAATLKFDSAKDLAPVTLIASVANVLVSGAAFPPGNFKDLIEYARARPGQMNYSNPLGSYSHLDTLDLLARTGVKAVLIPSKGAGSTLTSIINGEIHFSFLNAASITPHVKGGRMKAFATTARERLPDLPEVPTMAEVGFPEVGSVQWNGFFMPARTPRAIVGKLHAATAQVVQRKPVQEAFVNSAVPITLSKSPEEFQEFVSAEIKRWARIIRDNDIRLE